MAFADNLVYRVPFAVNKPWFQQPIALQGVSYVLEFQYNKREQRWYMDILDISEQPLVLGIQLEIDRNLNGQYGAFVLPRGMFFVRDSSNEGQPPTLNSFALDHKLLFLDIGET